MGKKSCFIIMPFTSAKTKDVELNKQTLDYIYTEVIRLAISEYHVNGKSVFPDISRYDSNVGSIVSGIASQLNTSDLVIADLTGLNPNVMYELGVRHTLKRGTIIITQDIDSLPSDLRDYTVVIYKFSNDTIAQKTNYISFRDNLHKAISEILTTDKFDSPVLSYLKGKERYWKEDELRKLKDNIIIGGYIFDQYETIKELLIEIATIADSNDLYRPFGRWSALINNLASAISDINISFEDALLYEDIQAAKSLVSDILKKSALADYFSTYMQPFAEKDKVDLQIFKLRFFQEKYIDYFKLEEEYCEITLQNVFSDEGNFYNFFISGLEEYLQKQADKLGLSKKQLDEMLDKL